MLFLEWLGFGLALLGYLFLARGQRILGLGVEAIASTVLLTYGLSTKQYGLASANVAYLLISLYGLNRK